MWMYRPSQMVMIHAERCDTMSCPFSNKDDKNLFILGWSLSQAVLFLVSSLLYFLVILYVVCSWGNKLNWPEIKIIISHFQYLYAFNIVPMNKMEKDELVKQPQDVTECPYSWSERKQQQQQQQVRD